MRAGAETYTDSVVDATDRSSGQAMANVPNDVPVRITDNDVIASMSADVPGCRQTMLFQYADSTGVTALLAWWHKTHTESCSIKRVYGLFFPHRLFLINIELISCV